MQKPPPDHTILVWAMTVTGDLMSSYFRDLDEAEKFGRLNVTTGAWRTWDAFQLPPDRNASRGVLVASHTKLKPKPAVDKPARRPRQRIIPD